MQSIDELRSNLATYEAQKAQVEELLAQDSDNAEFQELNTSLAEVVDLTRDLLQEALQGSTALSDLPPSLPPGGEGGIQYGQPRAAPIVVETSAPAVSSFLPPQVAQQIRAAQQKAALQGDAPAAWGIGARCQAVWSGDGEWYNATITGVSAAGNFVVSFDEDAGGIEEVVRGSVRQSLDDGSAYRGVSAPARNKVDHNMEITEMPQWLEILPEDDEKTKIKKKKLQKSHKSKMRFAKLDKETKDRQQTWNSFQKGKVSKKKPAGFIGTKKTSMFSVPEGIGGKVGVTGSGREMTEAPTRGRHDFVGFQRAT